MFAGQGKLFLSLGGVRPVIMGHCKPGERLDVDEIAKSYETSVTPVLLLSIRENPTYLLVFSPIGYKQNSEYIVNNP